MATKKISELSAASALTGAEAFELVQSGASKKGLISAIRTLFAGAPDASYAMTGTWAQLVAAHATTPFALNTRLRCSDVGVNGSDWSVNSSNEIYPLAPITLHTATDSYARAPTGTIGTGASGNITFGTAAARAYTEGLYVYLPTIATTPAITAGYYWCVMSSTTVGTLYASKGGAAINFSAGAGYTGVTTSVAGQSIFTLKGGVMGSYRRIQFSCAVQLTNNANVKYPTLWFENSGSSPTSSAASRAGASFMLTISARGSASRQLFDGAVLGNESTSPLFFSVDTSTDRTFSLGWYNGTTATDWIIFDRFIATLFPR